MVGLPAQLLGWTTHVRKLRLGVSKGILPVKNFAPTNSHDGKSEQMAPNPRKLLNGQGYEESPGLNLNTMG